MRWMIIQQAGQHAANAQFRECECMKRALKRIGHECVLWGRDQIVHTRHAYAEVLEWCDAVLFLENYDALGWTPNLSNVKKPKLFWSIDGHCAFEHHVQLCARNKFDVVLNSCLSCVDRMSPYCDLSLWFPNCYPSDLIAPVDGIERTVNVGYCGSLGNPARSMMIERLRAHADLRTDINVIGEDMVRALSSYKISFNRNLSHDINYRTFESMGANALLLTNATSGLHALLLPDTHCVTYSDFDDCVDKINYYIEHEDERKAIADAGTALARDKHTYDARALKLVEITKEVA